MSEKPKEKTEAFSFRVDKPLKDALIALAKADDRPVATYVIRVLREHVSTAPAAKPAPAPARKK